MQKENKTAACVIRRAQPEDMELILALTGQIFEEEQQIPREMNSIPAEKQPQWWCMEQDGEIVGTAALYREGEQWHMGRITIAPQLRGQHKGTYLLRAVLTQIFGQGVDNIFLEARDATVHILCGMGAEIVGEPVPFYRGNVTPIVLTRTAFLRHTAD